VAATVAAREVEEMEAVRAAVRVVV